MGNIFIATPHGTTAPFAPIVVAAGATPKTMLQVAVPATGADAKILGWGVSFTGIASGDPAGVCELFDCAASTLASVTSLTPDKWRDQNDAVSNCVGGAALTGYNATAEGTITAYAPHDIQEVHPQTGYSVWFPDGLQPFVALSRQIRVRTTFSVNVNCIPWVVWEEPA